MPRPRMQRNIHCEPGVTYFKPRGIPLTDLLDVNITVDEYEALRLVDLQSLEQVEAAKRMGVSQPTLHRILRVARGKVADALVNGKAMQIKGGVYTLSDERQFKCYACGHAWSEPYGTGRPSRCPICEKTNIHRSLEDRGGHGRHGLHCPERPGGGEPESTLGLNQDKEEKE